LAEAVQEQALLLRQ
jgi:hypothetical protein